MSAILDNPTPAGIQSGAFPLLGRAAGGVWFLLLAVVYGREVPALIDAVRADGGSFASWAPLLSRGCALAFYMTLAWLMMIRPPAVSRRPGLAARVIALGGTYGVWVVGFLPQSPLPPALALLATATTLVGCILVIFTITHLGRSFSIGPQARELVTGGPYALVRHPLYAAEEIALIGVAMHVVWYVAVPFLVVHAALQLKRMNYEEQLLGQVFPRYAAYARRTARWVPGIW